MVLPWFWVCFGQMGWFAFDFGYDYSWLHWVYVFFWFVSWLLVTGLGMVLQHVWGEWVGDCG